MVCAIPPHILYTLIIHFWMPPVFCFMVMACETFTILAQEAFILYATLPLIPFAPALLGGGKGLDQLLL